MKIRNGFVSNSSSSSFLVVAKKPELCSTCQNHFGLSDMIRIIFQTGSFEKDKTNFIGEVAELRNRFKFQIRTRANQLKHYKANLKTLKQLEQNSQAIQALTLIGKDLESLQWVTYTQKNTGLDFYHRLRLLEDKITAIEAEIKSITEKLLKLKKYGAKYEVLSVEISHGATVESLIKEYTQRPGVEVLEQVNS